MMQVEISINVINMEVKQTAIITWVAAVVCWIVIPAPRKVPHTIRILWKKEVKGAFVYAYCV